METQDVQIRVAEYQGKPLHVIKPIYGEEYIFVRAAEWAIWGTDAGHTSTLNHALKSSHNLHPPCCAETLYPTPSIKLISQL